MVMGMFLFSLMGTFVLAEETIGVISDIQISPVEEVTDSSGIFWNQLQRSFTFNKQNKAEISMKIADKRMLQAEEHFQKGDFNKAKVAKQNHEKAMVKAEAYIEDLIENGNEESVRKALARTIMMQNRIETHNEKSLEIHARILENNAGQMTEEQLSHLEEVFGGIQERSEIAEAKMVQQQENLRARYKVLTGMTDEEISTTMNAYDNFLSQQREQRQIRMQQHIVEMEQYNEQFGGIVNNSNSGSGSSSGSGSGNQQTGQIVLN